MNQSSSPDGDPFFWDPETLVAQLYNEDEPWFAPDVDLPTPDALLNAFKRLRIGGRLFLTWGNIRHNTYAELFADLGITLPDHRFWLLDALEYLQGRSEKYESWTILRTSGVKSKRLPGRISEPTLGQPQSPVPLPIPAPQPTLTLSESIESVTIPTKSPQSLGISSSFEVSIAKRLRVDGSIPSAAPAGTTPAQSVNKKRRIAPTLITEPSNDVPITNTRKLCEPFFGAGTFRLRNRLPDSDDTSDEDDKFCMVNTRRHARIQPKKAYRVVLSVFKGGAGLKNLREELSGNDSDDFVVGNAYAEDADLSDEEDSDSDEEQPAADVERSLLVQKSLSPDDIDAVIDSRICQFVDMFKSNYLPRMNRNAFDTWSGIRENRLVGKRLHEAHTSVHHMDNRIKLIRDQMHLSTWSSRDALWHQTMSLELSVIEREKSKWMIGLLNGPAPKRKTQQKLVSRPLVKKKQTDYVPSDSDGENISDSDSMGSFIVSDEAEAEAEVDVPESTALSNDILPANNDAESDVEMGDVLEIVDQVAETEETQHSENQDSEMDISESESEPRHNEDRQTLPLASEELIKPDVSNNNNNNTNTNNASQPPTSPSSPISVISISDDDEDESANELKLPAYDLTGWKAVPLDAKRLFPEDVLKEHGDLARFLFAAIYMLTPRLRQRFFAAIESSNDRPLAFWNESILRARQDLPVQAVSIALFMGTVKGVFKAISLEELQRRKNSLISGLIPYHLFLTPFFSAIKDIYKNFPQSADDMISSSDISEDDDEAIMSISTPQKAKKQRFISKEASSAFSKRMMIEKARWDRKVELAKLSKQQAQSRAIPSSRARLILNMSKNEDLPFIYIPDAITSATNEIYDTQIEGMRFIWDNTVANDGKHSSYGCMLAHTMGLGKTMQVIAILLTIAESSHSSDKGVVAQIPKRLHTNRFVVLCPAPLVDNWVKEIHKWTRHSIMPKVYSLAHLANEERAEVVALWKKCSGTLIVSYSLLARLISSDISFGLTIIEAADLVVADEAHTINNVQTVARMACDKFVTKHRIALTGSPMANNTMEYYHMVNWISHDYMGSENDFKVTYAKPIEDANVVDATPHERYRGRLLLKRLTKKIRHKVHRATLASLPTNVLPRKQEYIIGFPPLEGLQKRLYTAYVNLYREYDFRSEFGAIDNLSLILTHPKCLEMKLRKNLDTGKDQADKNSLIKERETMPMPMVNALLRIIEEYPNRDDLYLSWRTRHIMTIMDECRKAREKLLVFSQYLDVLDFFEQLFAKQGRKFCRIDGSTAKRVDIVNRFNNGDFEIFLISTKAGGTGLNMQGASRIIIVDFKYNPMWEQQAIGRAYRIKQTRDVFVYRFVGAGTSEASMFQRAVFKMQLTDAVVDDKSQVARAHGLKGSNVVHISDVECRTFERYIGTDDILDKLLLKYPNDQVQSGVVYVDHTDTFKEPELDIVIPAEIEKNVNDELRAIEQRELTGQSTADIPVPRSNITATGSKSFVWPLSKPPRYYHEEPLRVRLSMLVNERNSMPKYSTQVPITLAGSNDTDFPEHAEFRGRLKRIFHSAALEEPALQLDRPSMPLLLKTAIRSTTIDDNLSLNHRGELPRRAREKLLLDLMQQRRFALALLEHAHGVDNDLIATSTDKGLRDKALELEVMSAAVFLKGFSDMNQEAGSEKPAAPAAPAAVAAASVDKPTAHEDKNDGGNGEGSSRHRDPNHLAMIGKRMSAGVINKEPSPVSGSNTPKPHVHKDLALVNAIQKRRQERKTLGGAP